MIITDLFDLDFYKLTMAQYAFVHGKNTWVKYEFTDRTKNSDLFHFVDISKLSQELENVRKSTFSNVDNLKKLNIFSDDFIEFLRGIGTETELPKVNICIAGENDISISVEGFWPVTILWETYILSIVNEMYCANKRVYQYQQFNVNLDDTIEVGLNKLKRKIDIIKDYKYPAIKIAEFGTRRRFSKSWQKTVMQRLYDNDITNMTSNVANALYNGYSLFGTFAHELPMIVSGIYGKKNDKALYKSQNIAFDTWYDMYKETLPLIALSDTFTSDYTFETFGKERAMKWHGFRHDSGDPFIFANNVLDKYKEWGIDPKQKTIVFSDNLNVNSIISLYEEYCDEINLIFGWGTDLTNDMGYNNALSIVMKATEVNGVQIVKLSDSAAKISGNSDAVKRYKRVFIDHEY